MRLSELIGRLEELRDDLRAGLGDECDPIVLAATQPHWPLTGSLQSALVLDDVVWLAIGSAPDDVNPYAPKAVFEA